MRPFALVLLTFAACAPPLPLEGAPCPCVTGWVCCPGLDLCAQAPDRCEAILGPEVTPAVAEVAVNRTLQFTSSVQGVTWEVEEGLFAGSIEPSGLYFAPLEPGLFHVVARSKLGATRVAVTVRELRLSVLAGRPGGPASVPIDGAGAEARVASPWGGVFVAGSYFFADTRVVNDPTFGDRRTSLRRFDPVTNRIDTLFTEHPELQAVDGPRERAVFRHIAPPTIGGLRTILVFDDFEGCVREVDAIDFSVRRVQCGAFGGIPPGSWVGDEQFIYEGTPGSKTIVRFPRDGGAGETVYSSPQDAGLYGGPSGLELKGGTLTFVENYQTVARALDLGTRQVSDLWTTTSHLVKVVPFNGTFYFLHGDGALGARDGLQWGPAYGFDVETPTTLLMSTPDGIVRANVFGRTAQLVAGKSASSGLSEDGVGAGAGFATNQGFVLTSHGDTLWLSEAGSPAVRSITRDGRVTTLLRDLPALSLAVDDAYVYGTSLDELCRAPKRLGASKTCVPLPSADSELLGVLDDGRMVLRVDAAIHFVDPATFTFTNEVFDAIGLTGGQGLLVLDPHGGLYIGRLSDDGAQTSDPNRGVFRYDFATRSMSRVAPGITAPVLLRTLVGRDGRFYASGIDPMQPIPASPETNSTVVFGFDPRDGFWRPFAGRPGMGTVQVGPLSTALVHEPRGLAVFPNGDLAILDRAEEVMLVVE